MKEITAYEIDPETGDLFCPIDGYALAICETHHGYACDEGPTGHFLHARYVPEYGTGLDGKFWVRGMGD